MDRSLLTKPLFDLSSLVSTGYPSLWRLSGVSSMKSRASNLSPVKVMVIIYSGFEDLG